MQNLLNEVKVLMHESGYSIEDIKKVVETFEHFFDYVLRNKLEKEFDNFSDFFRNNVLKRIDNNKGAANIASAAEFNGTSPASSFIKECVERRVQSVLQGFLRSSEVYYNMACNSEGVDASLLLAQLSLDGIDRDKSIELTAPTTIMAFSTELSLKTLYSVKNYVSILGTIYSEVTKFENGRYPNEILFNDKLKMIEQVSGDWKKIGLSDDAQSTMNAVRDSFPSNDRPVGLLEDDRFGNVKVNGHTLYKVFDNLPEEIKNMIKYQIVTAFSRGDKFSLDQKIVSAIDYFLMISQVDTNVANIDSTKQMILNSNNFDRMRYLIDQLGSEELLFSMAFASSSYIVAKSEVEGKSFSSVKSCDYVSRGLEYTSELDRLISENPEKKYLLDYIVNNRELLNVVKLLNRKDLYVLIDMFNLDEINWMKESCNIKDSCSFKEMMQYCVFFKRHLNDYEFRYTGDKYKNINRLFYTIRSTNNLALLGSQISQWFAEINIYSLSQEEFDTLKIFDNEFIYNSLSFKDRILYKKCDEKGVPFKIYYTGYVYSSMLDQHIDSTDFDINDFESEIFSSVNSNFSRVLFLKKTEGAILNFNSDVMEYLISEFGSKENIPVFLANLSTSQLRVIINYCLENNVSFKNWTMKLFSSSNFICKNLLLNRELGDDKLEVKETRYKLNFAPNSRQVIDRSKDRISPLSNEDIMYYRLILSRIANPYKFFDDGHGKPLFVPITNQEDDLEQESNVEKLRMLLNNGYDYLAAVYMSNKCDLNQIIYLVDTFIFMPKDVYPLVASGILTPEFISSRLEFLNQKECILANVPLHYYLNSKVSNDELGRLMDLFNGIYEKENIPRCFFVSDVDSVKVFIDKIKENGINLYDFMSYVSYSTHSLLTNVDRYIYVYKVLKTVELSTGMKIKSFDDVVRDYEKIKRVLKIDGDNSILLKASLYNNFDDLRAIVEISASYNMQFYPELLYFEKDFLNTYFDQAYMCVCAYRMSKRELEYQDAYNVMETNGWYQREYVEEYGKPKK